MMPQFQAEISPEEHTNNLIREAKAAKARILPNKVKGNDYKFIAQMDEDYLVVGGHIDEGMQSKIINGEYVDFGKLLPRDRIASEEDSHLELVMRNGKTFWMPVSETVTISNFSKWEQAFRIYSNIYTKRFPNKSTELIQYNHIIHTIASIYTWKNVYMDTTKNLDSIWQSIQRGVGLSSCSRPGQ